MAPAQTSVRARAFAHGRDCALEAGARLSHFARTFSLRCRGARNPGLRQTTAKRPDVNSLALVSVEVRPAERERWHLNTTSAA